MDKKRRFELKMLKFKRRLTQLGLLFKEGNFHCYKTTGKPCSCYMCKGERYSRKHKHKNKDE